MNTSSVHYSIPQSYTLVYMAPFKTTYVDQENHIMLNIWNLNSANISEEEYKKDAMHNVELVRKFGIGYFISDVTHNKFSITPELQVWYADIPLKALGEEGLQRCGIIMDTDLNLLSSLEEIAANALSRNGVPIIPHRFFANLEEALKWMPRS